MEFLGVNKESLTVADYFSAASYINAGRLYIEKKGLSGGIGDIFLYDSVNDGNPTYNVGSSSTDRLEIQAHYNSGAQTLEAADFTTYTSSSGANDGKFRFYVDEVNTFQIKDDGINLSAGKDIRFNNTVILQDDGSGVATLSNIDALDATTEATIESAIDTLGNFTSSTALTSLANLTTVGTIGTGVWQGTAIASAYLDADTAHLSGVQTFTGAKTFSGGISGGLTVAGATSGTPSTTSASIFTVGSTAFEDTNTSASGTAAKHAFVSLNNSTLTAENASVTTTNAATLYIKNAPSAGTNQTITNAWGLWVDAGKVRFDQSLYMGTTQAMNNSGLLTVANQSNITGLSTITSGTWNGTAIASAYLDADTMHYSAQRQLTHHMFQDDINTDKIYIGLQESDAETGTATNKNLPLLAPVAGKLLKLFVRANSDVSSIDYTWRLELRTTSENTSGTPSGTFGTQSGNGPTNQTMVTYDFTSSLDAGSNAIAVGDTVQLSVQADSDPGGNIKYYVTCLWEWDLS